MQRCKATINFFDQEKPYYPPTVNDEGLHEHFQTVAVDILGIGKVKEAKPLMGSEDFAFYQEVLPGYFYFLGLENKSQKQLHFVHSPNFEINEDALPYGAALHASLAATYLHELQSEAPLPEKKHHDEL